MGQPPQNTLRKAGGALEHEMVALGRIRFPDSSPVPLSCRRPQATIWICSGWASSWPCAPSRGSPGMWPPQSSPLLTSTASRWRRRPVPRGSSLSSWESGRTEQGTSHLTRSGQLRRRERGFPLGIWARKASPVASETTALEEYSEGKRRKFNSK